MLPGNWASCTPSQWTQLPELRPRHDAGEARAVVLRSGRVRIDERQDGLPGGPGIQGRPRGDLLDRDRRLGSEGPGAARQ
jgi:hypothetical protein